MILQPRASYSPRKFVSHTSMASRMCPKPCSIQLQLPSHVPAMVLRVKLGLRPSCALEGASIALLGRLCSSCFRPPLQPISKERDLGEVTWHSFLIVVLPWFPARLQPHFSEQGTQHERPRVFCSSGRSFQSANSGLWCLVVLGTTLRKKNNPVRSGWFAGRSQVSLLILLFCVNLSDVPGTFVASPFPAFPQPWSRFSR